MKKAVVSVINDLSTDQRVHKSCLALQKAGYEVMLIGRKLPQSLPLADRSYACRRMRLLFVRGPFFYAEYNLRLFFKLLFKPAQLYFANDLDTLLPNFIVSRLYRRRLIYDSHEYFTETPELVDRKRVQRFWKFLEKKMLPKLDSMITVNESIANLFREEYKLKVQIVRNIPLTYQGRDSISRKELALPEDKKLLIMQGAGINIERGAEELVEAMQFLPDMHLLMIGGGDVWKELQERAATLGVAERIHFLARMPYEKMMAYTQVADLGLSLDKPTNINYKFSLPNKLFDYIHAGIPVLVSRLPELERIVETYEVGSFIPNHQPEKIAEAIKDMFRDAARYALWKQNTKNAAENLNWELEEQQLLNYITS